MKRFGDAAYCQGINHFVMHGFTHNPWDDRYQPGMSMGIWGTQLNRHVTWWPYSADWHRYLARCHFMLQQGQPVADVLTYPPRAEHIPSPVLDTSPYRQTVLNDETLLKRLRVRAGRLVLPHGTSYRAIALVAGQPLRPEILRRLRDLVTDGAVLIGQRPPSRSASLEDYPACDQEVADLIDQLWGQSAQQHGETIRELGKGKIISGRPLVSALNELTGGPDFTCRRLNIPLFSSAHEITVPRVLFFHRNADRADVYFVSNQEDEVVEIAADFRIAGKQPECWNPVSGDIQILPDYDIRRGRTKVPLKLEPRQSLFIVFRKPAVDEVVSDVRNFATLRQVLQLAGPWDVSFNPKWGGPENVTFDALADWTQRNESGIRYYSGAATYRKQFDLPLVKPSRSELYLDLGTIRNLARVRLNDRDLGVVWCAPWRVSITDAIVQGENRLEITVVNTWVNRLIGDEQLPEDTEMVVWNPAARKGGYAVDVPGRG